MSPTVVSTARDTNNVASTQIRIDMAQKVLELEPSKTPLLVLSKRADSSSCHNPKFQWHEDQLEVRFSRAAAANSGITQTVTTGTGPQFGVDDLVFNTRTQEIYRVTVQAGDSLTLAAAPGTASATNDELIILGSAYLEGATSNPARSINPAPVFNYTQIFRTPIESTGTYRATENEHSPADWNRTLNRKGIEHAKSIEYTALFGKPTLDTSGAHPRRTTGGTYNYIANNNKTDAGGTFTEAEFFASLRPIFRYGSDVKLGVASPLVVDVLNGFPRGKLEVQQEANTDTFGLNVTRYRSPHGILNVVTHWLMEGDKYANEMLVLDLSNFSYKYLAGNGQNRDTALLQDRQAPDADTTKAEYLTECGWVVGLPATHGTVINVTG